MEFVLLILLIFAVLIWLTPMLLKTLLRRIVKHYMGVDINAKKRGDKQSKKTDSKNGFYAGEEGKRPHPTDGHKIFGDDEGEYINYTEIRDSE